MKLTNCGITRDVESPKVAAELKKAGYVEVEEPEEIQAPETEGGDQASEVKKEPNKAGK